MKIKNLMTDWEWLSLRVFILGLTVFLWSYITEIDGISEVFGDVWRKKYTFDEELELHWGFRHFVYTITFALLTLVQAFRIIKWIDVRSKNNGFEIKDTKK
jgi:hypothetical protein